MYSEDFDDDDYYFPRHKHYKHRLSTMEIVTIVASVIGIIIVLVLLCRCCRRRNQGQIISHPPPVPPGPLSTAPYPQQQVIVAYPVSSPYPAYPATMGPVGHVGPVGPVGPVGHVGHVGAMVSPQAPPTAPDLHALPPSYEQATGADKQSPYNPAYPR